MSNSKIEAFEAITNFVKDLFECFGKGPRDKSPLALYHRLISHIKYTDITAIDKSITGFHQFFARYGKEVITGELDGIPRGVSIPYGTASDRIRIDIQSFIHKSDEETKDVIREHLLTINGLLEEDEGKLTEIEKQLEQMNINSRSKEGQFVQNIMQKAQASMENIDADNPGQAIAGLLSSGIINEMLGGLNQGIGSGEMDINKLFSTMQSSMAALMPQMSEQFGAVSAAVNGGQKQNEIEIKESGPIIEEQD